MSIIKSKKFSSILIGISCTFFILYFIYSGDRPTEGFMRQVRLRPKSLSTCSEEATAYGKGQKVISYSFFIKQETTVARYLKGIKPNLQIIPLLYPGWVVRIYTDEVPRLQNTSSALFTDYKFLFWCDVTKIPGLGDIRRMVAMTWRFLPLGDPTVDIFISRDLDSRISTRERKAVEEWENSNYSFHSMRDHPYHHNAYLGGMWGAKNTLLGREQSLELQKEIIEASVKVGGKTRDHDQSILGVLYNRKLSNETMAHDSYFCKHYPDKLNIGFPTQRESPEGFVGNIIVDQSRGYEVKECPEECRRHKEWTNC